jgi:aspartyl-tRNA(Asn)/glutamyl-tRNA(Gln) amidotransferase subunit C
MPIMTKEEISHLGKLSRIALIPKEIDVLQTEIEAILAYVSTVTAIVSNESVSEKSVGARYNVLRPDEVTVVSGEYTETLLSAMPHREGQFMSVKKILNQTE